MSAAERGASREAFPASSCGGAGELFSVNAATAIHGHDVSTRY
ncbi:hypothetical protein [Xanthobacter agilis]